LRMPVEDDDDDTDEPHEEEDITAHSQQSRACMIRMWNRKRKTHQVVTTLPSIFIRRSLRAAASLAPQVKRQPRPPRGCRRTGSLIRSASTHASCPGSSFIRGWMFVHLLTKPPHAHYTLAHFATRLYNHHYLYPYHHHYYMENRNDHLNSAADQQVRGANPCPCFFRERERERPPKALLTVFSCRWPPGSICLLGTRHRRGPPRAGRSTRRKRSTSSLPAMPQHSEAQVG
jgi:hypothetical protein